MRLLTLSWEYPPNIAGGLGRHVAELVPALVQQGVTVDVVTPTDELAVDQYHNSYPPSADLDLFRVSVVKENGINVHRVYVAHIDASADIYYRATEVNQALENYVLSLTEQGHSWDLLHAHDWLTGFASIALQRICHLPLVATIHATERGRGRGYLGNPLQRAIDQAEQDLIELTDRIIVCSHYMSKELQAFFGVAEDKLAVVPNGVDIDSLLVLYDETPQEFRRKYAAPEEQMVFTVSRLVHEKGVHRLLDATPLILAKCPHTQIVVAGRGPEAENLQRQANHLGISDHVQFIGFVPDEVRNLLFKVADCAVFPSLYEPFGIVALEAMALGCPVIVSDVGGLSEVVAHKKTGITVYPDDPRSVAWGVLRALRQPESTREFAANARRQVEELFNWTRIARATKKVYQSVIAAVHANSI